MEEEDDMEEEVFTTLFYSNLAFESIRLTYISVNINR